MAPQWSKLNNIDIIDTVDIVTGKNLHAIISEGRIQVFTKFYDFFFQKLLLTSDKYVKDLFIAEEVVQNVFLKIWEAPENLEEIKSIKSYLYKSVINASINHVNRQKNIELHHQKIAADFSEEHLIELDEENELIILLHREIDKLPPQCQKVFKLNRFEHLKYKEIAMLLDISEKTVENHIGTALKTLRKSMSAKKTAYNSQSYRLIVSLFLY